MTGTTEIIVDTIEIEDENENDSDCEIVEKDLPSQEISDDDDVILIRNDEVRYSLFSAFNIIH